MSEKDSVLKFLEDLFVATYILALVFGLISVSLDGYAACIAVSAVITLIHSSYEFVRNICYDPQLGF